ncbi:MAG: glycosyltransferase [Chloroflexi bacterium]|nr:glycosyltransferase [Chloroflexota bacterium]
MSELPPPPPGKTGWPWTEESPQLPDAMPDGSPWPRVSIVTPSYNQGRFVEETIRSVLLQGYPDLEYIVIDGGSTDGSVEVICKYAPWLTYWVSEPDRGQAHAINKGVSLATGEIFGWLNSDDVYMPSALATVAYAYRQAAGDVIAGSVLNVYEGLEEQQLGRLYTPANLYLEAFIKFWEEQCVWHQPGIFFPAQVWRKTGGLDDSLRYMMDFDLISRVLQHVSVTCVPRVLVHFRLHPTSKTCSQHLGMFTELVEVSRRYWHLVPGFEPKACYAFSTDHLVRWAGTEALAGRYQNALAYLESSFKLDLLLTLRALAIQCLAGVSRRVGSALRQYFDPLWKKQ